MEYVISGCNIKIPSPISTYKPMVYWE